MIQRKEERRTLKIFKGILEELSQIRKELQAIRSNLESFSKFKINPQEEARAVLKATSDSEKESRK